MESHALTLTFDGLAAQLITPIRISEAFDPRVVDPQKQILHQFNAIWDTGATATSISSNVVNACGLKPIDMVLVATATKTEMANVYLGYL